jgi:hypothetical protein
MALFNTVASELLEAFRAREGVDLIRESVRLVMQELIETEAAEKIGAGRYERTERRVTDRNGSRPRLLSTQAGDLQLTPTTARSRINRHLSKEAMSHPVSISHPVPATLYRIASLRLLAAGAPSCCSSTRQARGDHPDLCLDPADRPSRRNPGAGARHRPLFRL